MVGSVFGLGLLLIAFKPRNLDAENIVIILVIFLIVAIFSGLIALLLSGGAETTVTISEGALHK